MSWSFPEISDLGIGVCCEGCACGCLKGKILDSVINCSKLTYHDCDGPDAFILLPVLLWELSPASNVAASSFRPKS